MWEGFGRNSLTLRGARGGQSQNLGGRGESEGVSEESGGVPSGGVTWERGSPTGDLAPSLLCCCRRSSFSSCFTVWGGAARGGPGGGQGGLGGVTGMPGNPENAWNPAKRPGLPQMLVSHPDPRGFPP